MSDQLKDRLSEMFTGQIPPERRTRIVPSARRDAAVDAVFQGEKPIRKIGFIDRLWYLTLGAFLCGFALFILGVVLVAAWGWLTK